MNWVDKGHQERFLELMAKTYGLYASDNINPEYGAAFYLLTANEDVWRRCAKYVSCDGDGIKFENILNDGTFSSGEYVLVELAAALFSPYWDKNGKFSINDMITDVDDVFFIICLNALCLRRNGSLDSPKNKTLRY